MMLRHVLELCIGVIIILMLAVVLSRPATAAEPCYYTMDEAVADVGKSGGYLIDLVEIPGEQATHILIAAVDGYIQIWGVKDWCMVGMPVPYDVAKDLGLPA